MAEKKETLKTEDFTKASKEIRRFVKESYPDGVEFALSLWEENLKFDNIIYTS